ncbi:MAG: type II CRISPR-associated endonuclease Cas1 [Phycisphaeraceae bacterium]|nr:type II CRISPR-associated endonuclease Cas1 [Phycisphaeraceae bacterium]
MIKRTIEISRQATHLSIRHDQLLIQPFDQPKETAHSIPTEDIGLVVIDHPRTTYSHSAMQALMRQGAAVVICGRDHLPAGIMLPLSEHTEQVTRLKAQINASRPLLKQLWRQLVAAKIRAQRCNVPADSPEARRLSVLAGEVKSGDTTNVEAQAARVYWSCWRERFGRFKRDPDGQDSINAMLNYGYAVLRAALGRAIVAGGLHPALGIHHHNRANAFCLADDLIEPLRPLADRRVLQLHLQKRTSMNQSNKAHLLSMLTSPAEIAGQSGPLMVQLHRTVASLVHCLLGERKTLDLCRLEELEQRPCTSADIGACGS